MNDYLAYLANCPLRGIEMHPGNKNGKAGKYPNLIRINIDGFVLELHQDNKLPSNLSELRGGQICTTELYVRGVDKEDLNRLQETIGYVSELLSFATESRVLPYAFEFPVGSSMGQKLAMVGTVQRWRPPFDNPEDVKKLVETCYDEYVRLRNPRMLHVAIDYMHHTVMKGLAREIQIGLACVAFENLRHNWAIDNGYPHINGFFREKTATQARPGNPVGIKRHLEEMFSEVGMVSDEERIFDTRNEVIHTGLYGNIGNDDTYEFLENALREYFLRVVGYHGQFMPYCGGSPTPCNI